MNAVPFRRVAVLPEGLVSPTTFDLVPGWLHWLANAHALGADAYYFRRMSAPGRQTLDALEELARQGYCLIVPAAAQNAYKVAGAVHFPEIAGSLPITGKICGRSCHSMEGLRQAMEAGFDYAFFSPVYSTTTHPEALPLGLNALENACRAVPMAVFALGGITNENEAECLARGAHGVAAIGMFAQ